MVGCLGGIGQLLALWMAERGAKHFAFLSRSGTENNAGAAETVIKLEDQGAHVTILRADVTDYEALAREVARVDTAAFPIRGVVNAATLLLDTVFANMTLDMWHGVAGAKVQGSLNLHRLLSAEPLDFFVMTSSIASAIGSTAQSNYSAANAVLDALAVHRRCRGVPAISVILPAIFGVGAMTKSPEMVESVKFKGMYGIDKDEMLAVFDIALRPQHELPAGLDHIGMGMQPRRFAKSLAAVDAHMRWEDPRLNWFKFALDKENHLDSNNGSGKGGHSKGPDIMTRVRQASSRELAVDELAAYIGKRLATLLMIDIEVLQSSNKSIAGHGLDSMIGVELRNWLYREFGVELPFQQLLASSLTVEGLAEIMYEEVKGKES